MPLSFVQSIMSARSWEKLPILLSVSEVRRRRRRRRAVSLPPHFLAEGLSRAAGTCCASLLGRVVLSAPCRGSSACCRGSPVFPVPQCHNTELRLASTCLFIIQFSFYYPAFSYLCPLLKVDLFILESLSFLCPGVHLLVSLFHLFPA